eukprot:Lithocolla_globosa_v1_NODE_822_length_3233_cov_120.909062.p1 type:complete len:726 gc:universal NODE_822_length_3233_cov_120.909062:2201-24(-)
MSEVSRAVSSHKVTHRHNSAPVVSPQKRNSINKMKSLVGESDEEDEEEEESIDDFFDSGDERPSGPPQMHISARARSSERLLDMKPLKEVDEDSPLVSIWRQESGSQKRRFSMCELRAESSSDDPLLISWRSNNQSRSHEDVRGLAENKSESHHQQPPRSQSTRPFSRSSWRRTGKTFSAYTHSNETSLQSNTNKTSKSLNFEEELDLLPSINESQNRPRSGSHAQPVRSIIDHRRKSIVTLEPPPADLVKIAADSSANLIETRRKSLAGISELRISSPPPPPKEITVINEFNRAGIEETVDFLRDFDSYVSSDFLLVKSPFLGDCWDVYLVAFDTENISLFQRDAKLGEEALHTIPIIELHDLSVPSWADVELLTEHTDGTISITLLVHSVISMVITGEKKTALHWLDQLRTTQNQTFAKLLKSTKLLDLADFLQTNLPHSVNGSRDIFQCDFLKKDVSIEDKYDISQVSSVGGFSYVRKLFSKKNPKEEYIGKFLNKEKSKIKDNELASEQIVLLTTKHENIVELTEVFYHSDVLIMIFPSFQNAIELYDYLTDKGALAEEESQIIIKQVVDAVNYLAERFTVHGDLKDENMIINPSTQQIKLIDFGSCKHFDPDKLFKAYSGTAHMACPEVVCRHPYNPMRQEIWSIGVLLVILISAEYPFSDENAILSTQFSEESEEYVEQLSDTCHSLLDLMFTNDEKGCDLQEIVDHEWFKDDIMLNNL